MARVEALIFDMDGVLVDVSASYREAIRRVPQVFFESVCRFKPMDGELVSPEVVEAFKLAGGLNNDWDCTAAVAAVYASVLPKTLPAPPESGGMSAYLKVLGEWGVGLRCSVGELAERADPLAVAERLAAEGGGLEAALSICGLDEGLFPIAFGSLKESNVIMRLFQEMYLGAELFEATYGEAPLVVKAPGLIEEEKLLMDRSVLEDLSRRMPLGIATGRPRSEAAHALRQHGIEGFFASVVDDDDVRQAEAAAESLRGEALRLTKPHPWSLLEAVRRIGKEVGRAAYVGDTPDDMKAARAANATVPFVAIGTGRGSQGYKRTLAVFREAGADIVLSHPDNLRLLEIWAA